MKFLTLVLVSFSLLGCDGQNKTSQDTSTTHAYDVTPTEGQRIILDLNGRKEIILDLAERLEKHPGIQAYLVGGSFLETNGSRNIYTIWNSASRALYAPGELNMVSLNLSQLILNDRGLSLANESFLRSGIPEGYRDDIFYQTNWDIGIYGRNTIIAMARQLRASEEK